MTGQKNDAETSTGKSFEERTAALRRRVAQEAQALYDRGVRPTVARVREALRGGSPNDIAPALKRWRESLRDATVGPKSGPPALPPALADLAREMWRSALATAAVELKHGPGAREIASRTTEAYALREQLQALRQQLERESLAYGELRALAARHEAIARDALAQLHQAQERERRLLRQLGEARQREAQGQAELQQQRKRTAVATPARHRRASTRTVKAKRPNRPREAASRPPIKRTRRAGVSHRSKATQRRPAKTTSNRKRRRPRPPSPRSLKTR